jgi:hypothetical protein
MSQYKRGLTEGFFPQGLNADQATIGAQELLGGSIEQGNSYEGIGQIQSVSGSLVVNGSLIVLDPSVPGQSGKGDDDYLFFHVDPAHLEVTAGSGFGYFSGGVPGDKSSERRHKLCARFRRDDGGLDWRDSDGKVVLRLALPPASNGNLLFFDGALFGRTVHLLDSYQRRWFFADEETREVKIGLFELDPVGPASGRIMVAGSKGQSSIRIDGEESDIHLTNGTRDTIVINGNQAQITLSDHGGKDTVQIDGNSGDIRLLGGDCAEEFDVADPADIQPGVVVEAVEGGGIQACRTAYQKRVVGVVSGAKGLTPGIVLHSTKNGKAPRIGVALVGKVYCQVDASFGAIEVGDLLTSSPTTGHAMRVDEPVKGIGCTIGKALESLAEGRGQILILAGSR